jgi:hypothetical protein
LALWKFSHKVNYVFAQVLALQSGLLSSFAPVVTTNFGDAAVLFIVIYLFFPKEKVVGYLLKLLSTCFKVTICH